MKQSYSFDDVSVTPDRQIGLHSHQSWELSYLICGAGERTIGDLTEPMEEGEIILIPAGIPHVWRFDHSHTDSGGNIANISVLFETATLNGLAALFPEIAADVGAVTSHREAVAYSGTARDKIRRILLSMRGLTPAARLPKFIKLIRAIADSSECVSAGHSITQSRSQRRLEKIRVFCACNFRRHISLDEVALHVGMNKSALCTFMRHNAGMTFSEYLNNMRLERAEDRLRHTDQIIAAIAYDVGFSNDSYFNRIFRRRYGCTPRSIRTIHIVSDLISEETDCRIPDG